MNCDECGASTGWDLQIRPHPDSEHWHIHYCTDCAYFHDYEIYLNDYCHIADLTLNGVQHDLTKAPR